MIVNMPYSYMESYVAEGFFGSFNECSNASMASVGFSAMIGFESISIGNNFH